MCLVRPLPSLPIFWRIIQQFNIIQCYFKSVVPIDMLWFPEFMFIGDDGFHQLSRNCLTYLGHLSYIRMFVVFVLLNLQFYMQGFVHPFLFYLLTIVLSALLRYTVTDFQFGIFTLSFYSYPISFNRLNGLCEYNMRRLGLQCIKRKNRTLMYLFQVSPILNLPFIYLFIIKYWTERLFIAKHVISAKQMGNKLLIASRFTKMISLSQIFVALECRVTK